MTPGDAVVDRARELEALLAAARGARAGSTMIVTIAGEPGIGKTWLLDAIVAAARDLSVVTAPDAAFRTIDSPPTTPTIVLFDDAQRLAADVAERAAESILAVRTAPLLIVVAGQSPDDTLLARLRPVSCRDERGRDILLRGFGTQETVELAAEHRIVALDVARAELLVELTDGNPHHLVTAFEQLGQQLHGSIPRVLPVPASFPAHVRGRLDTMPPGGRTIVELLALARGPVAITTLATVAARFDGDLPIGPAIDDATATTFVTPIGDEGQRTLALASVRARTAIVERIPPARARAMHAALAPSMAGWTRFEHRLAAVEIADDDLAAELEAEAARHSAAGRYPSAARAISRAGGVSSSRNERERRLLTAGAYAFFADDAELAGTLEPSIRQCAPSVARTMVLGGIGYLLGNFAETLALVHEALASPEIADITRDQALFVASVAASIQLATVDIATVIATAETALAAWPPGTGAVGPSEARLRLAWGFAVSIVGDAIETERVLEPLIALPLTRPERADALTIVGQGLFYRGGRDVEALQTFELAIESARASHALHVLPLGLALRAQVEYSMGLWDAAMLDAQAVLAHTTASRNGNHDGVAHSVIAMIVAQSGELAEAQRAVRVSQRLGMERPLPQHRVGAAVAAAVVERAGGHPHAVVHALTPLLDGVLEFATTATGYTGWRAMHAEALIALGSLDKAAAVITRLEGETCTMAFGYPGWLRGLLADARGDRGGAIAHYRRALADGDETVTPLAHAFALGSLAGALAARNDIAAAAAARREADHLLVRVGATGSLPSVVESGADITSLAEWNALTPRERDAGLLASSGMLNREIASSMHVSVKTVEKHLANALAKLGLRSRRDLERAVGRGGRTAR